MTRGWQRDFRTKQPWGWDVVNIQGFGPIGSYTESQYGPNTWEAPYDLPPDGGDVRYHITGAGAGGHWGYAAQWNMYRPGGPGGQGGQYKTGVIHTRDLGLTEVVQVGSTFQMSGTWSSPGAYVTHEEHLNGRYAGLVTFSWPAYLGATEWCPGTASSFAGITALGGGMGFVSGPNDAGSGGAGGFLGADNADQPGQPGTVPADYASLGVPPPAGGQVAPAGLDWIEDAQIRDGEPGYGGWWYQFYAATGEWVYTQDITVDSLFFPGCGGGGGASTALDGDGSGWGGSAFGTVGGGGGGAGSFQRQHWVSDEFWWWWGWEGPSSYGGSPGHGGYGAVVIVTQYKVYAKNRSYLRMNQRDDVLGVAQSPRLAGAGSNNPTSAQLGKPQRLGTSNRYI